jgi:hypothetical protein
MPVIKRTGPLPPGHPFAGTRIIFIHPLMRQQLRDAATRNADPMAQAVDTVEQFLRTRQHVGNDDGEVTP